jgi:hypothetical protein
METLGDKNKQKTSNCFYCIDCDYKCYRRFNWDRHILSTKHKKSQNRNKKEIKTEQNEPIEQTVLGNYTCEYCNKSYKSRNGLWRHKKKCIKEDKVNNEKDLMLIIIKDNIELKKIILEQQQLLLEIVNKPL